MGAGVRHPDQAAGGAITPAGRLCRGQAAGRTGVSSSVKLRFSPPGPLGGRIRASVWGPKEPSPYLTLNICQTWASRHSRVALGSAIQGPGPAPTGADRLLRSLLRFCHARSSRSSMCVTREHTSGWTSRISRAQRSPAAGGPCVGGSAVLGSFRSTLSRFCQSLGGSDFSYLIDRQSLPCR